MGKSYTCICGEVLTGLKQYKKHLSFCQLYRESLPPDSYQVCDCGYMCQNKFGFSSHITTCVNYAQVHKPELLGEWKCVCGSVYPLELSFLRHCKSCKVNVSWEAEQKKLNPNWVRHPSWVYKFLDKLKDNVSWPNYYQIARDIGIGHDVFANYYGDHPELKEAVEAAEAVAIKVLEKHCWNKATGLVKGGSDTLAIFMLNAHRPDKYKHPLRRDGPVGPVDIQFKIVPNKKTKE